MIRFVPAVALAIGAFASGAALAQQATQPRPATPAQKPAAKPAAAAGPAGAQATLIGTFNDWSAYTSQSGRSKTCYALSRPKDRLPKGLNRDDAYLFVSFRPADKVQNEVALVMGFPTKEGGPAEAAIGPSTYALVTKGSNAWLGNPKEEGQVIANMQKVQAVVVKATSARGNQLTDRYSLAGFSQALERAKKECP